MSIQFSFYPIKKFTKSKVKFSRYNLKNDIMWCLNSHNGWIRIYNTMIRWNTSWTTNYTYFSVEQIKVSL
jgi:hypothetical protein